MSEIDLKRFFLEQVRLFETFSAEKVEEIVLKSRLATFEGNEAILETGDEGKMFGVLISGHAEISMTDNTGTRSVIAQLEAGDVFGVMSLLTGDRVTADVIAGNRCFALMIPQEVFNTHILTNPKAVAYLSRLLAERTHELVDVAALRRPQFVDAASEVHQGNQRGVGLDSLGIVRHGLFLPWRLRRNSSMGALVAGFACL